MIGICIELKSSCGHCSSPLMLNAVTNDIICPACNKYNYFSDEDWQNLLEDAVKEGPGFKDGEGQPSTIMRGAYNFQMMYGKQMPRCGKCKTAVDLSKLDQYSAQGHFKCTKCQSDLFARRTDDILAKTYETVKYLVGEDDDMLKTDKSKGKAPESSKPVLFNCPSCAGNLEIDGKDRMVTCKYCSSEIYLPDDLWLRLHPVKQVARWYMVIDENALPSKGTLPEWYYLSDMLTDNESNTYFATDSDEGEGFIVWSIDKELNVRWIRKGLKYNHERTGMCLSYDGDLFLFSEDKNSILKLSSKDGSDILKIGGQESKGIKSFKGIKKMVSCPDGTLLANINNTLVRFNEDGERVLLWEAKKLGLFSAGIGNDIPQNDDEWSPYIKDVGSIPKVINGDFTFMNIGTDGYLYMLDKSSSDGELAKYEQSGTRVWSKYIPLNYKECRPCQDVNGNIYIIGTNENGDTRIIRYNTSVDRFDEIIKDLSEGGYLEEEDTISVMPDGTILAAKFYNRLKVFSPALEMIYRSEQSKEDDDMFNRRRKDKKDRDED